MRIFVMTNLYPPYYFGGYELRCRDIVEGLIKKGHSVTILTSNHGIGKNTVENNIHRILPVFIYGYTKIPSDGIPTQMIKAFHSIRWIRRLIKKNRIELIYMSKVQGIQEPVIAAVCNMGIPVVWDISDSWITTFGSESWYSFWKKLPVHRYLEIPKAVVQKVISRMISTRPIGVDFQNAIYTSNFLMNYYSKIGLPIGKAQVIHCGCPQEFFTDNHKEKPNQPFRFLYAGQLVETKGVHTILKAASILKEKIGQSSFRIDICGEGIPEYEQRLRNYVSENGLIDIVRFLGKVSRNKMPQVYKKCDAFILSSIWDEPFALTPLEAMASGVPVIGTTTGGSGEALKEGVTALTFEAGNESHLAAQMQRIISDSTLWNTLRLNGKEAVSTYFTVENMVNLIEDYLRKTLENVKLTNEHRAIDTREAIRTESYC